MHPYFQAVLDVARELNVPTVHYNGPRLDVIHPTRAGYQQLVKTLFDRLEAEGYIDAAPTLAAQVSASSRPPAAKPSSPQ